MISVRMDAKTVSLPTERGRLWYIQEFVSGGTRFDVYAKTLSEEGL